MSVFNHDNPEFIKPTYYCDIYHPEIQKIVQEKKLYIQDQRLLAISLFEYVRDEVKYHVGPWNKKASETLNAKKGMCTNSANLLVALLRAAGIPAGYTIYTVIGGESFGHILPPMLKKNIHKDSVHIVCTAFVGGRWSKCDPSTDSELSNTTKHISALTHLIEWDGENDAVHPMDPNHIISMSKPLNNIDYQLDKKPRFVVRNFIFHIGNNFIEFLRNEGVNLKNKEEIEQQFKFWMKKNHPYHYYRYNLLNFLNSVISHTKSKTIIKNKNISSIKENGEKV